MSVSDAPFRDAIARLIKIRDTIESHTRDGRTYAEGMRAIADSSLAIVDVFTDLVEALRGRLQ